MVKHIEKRNQFLKSDFSSVKIVEKKGILSIIFCPTTTLCAAADGVKQHQL